MKIRNLLFGLLLILSITAIPVKADTNTVPVTKVEDINSYTTYIPSDITYTTNYITDKQILELKLDKPSSVMLALKDIDVTNFSSNGSSGLSIAIYKEKELLNKLVDLGRGTSSSLYKGALYLDPGTYYVSIKADSNTCYGTYKIGTVVQESQSTEQIIPSSMSNPNTLNIGSTFKGFLSSTNKTDYYVIGLGKDQLIKMSLYRTSGSGYADVELLDSNYTKITSTQIKESYGENTLTSYLKAGTYFLKVTNSQGGGNYRAELKAEDYSIKVSKSTTKKTNQTITLYFDTNFSVSSGRVINSKDYKVTNQNKDDANTWRQGVGVTNTVSVNKNGTYYILLKDIKGNSIYTKYTVSNIDTDAPSTPIITSCKFGATKITGKGEKNANILINVNQNGELKQYRGKVNSKKKFSIKTCKLIKGSVITIYQYDAAGNYSPSKQIIIK